MKVLHFTLPGDRVRLAITADRMPPADSATGPQPAAELFTVWVEDAATRAERRFSELLLDCISFRMDRFVADAHSIPLQHRALGHETAYEHCAHMVHMLTGVHGRLGFDECRATIADNAPHLVKLDGLTSYPLHYARKRERNGIARMWHILVARLNSQHAPSCHECLLPTALCACTNAKAANA